LPVQVLAKRNPMSTPDLKLRRTWHDSGRPREDYEVIDERGEKVGRMYRTDAVGGGYAWRWTVYGIAVTNHPPAGQAPTREAAQAVGKRASRGSGGPKQISSMRRHRQGTMRNEAAQLRRL
jgi:hypothetical protein